MLRFLADKYFRVDARAAGLFRLAFGLTLIFDLFHRWDWLKAFYSNRGVLPNHNHLFNLRKSGGVWSALHSFSRVDEAFAAFCIIFVIYVLFTVGFFTRSMHLLSIIGLVSLCGRNVLLDNPGNSVAVVLALLSLMLPLGQRFSVDSLRRSFSMRGETTAAELNDKELDPSWRALASPAALALLLFVGWVPLADSLGQTGPSWSDGSALYFAVHTDRWASDLGLQLRPSVALLAAWTKALHYAGFGVLPLALIPLFRGIVRPLAVCVLAFWALSYGLVFNVGLYGWSMLAASLLLLPEELFERPSKKESRIDVIYDDDCGFCLLAARWLKRLDRRDRVHFLANTAEDLPEATPRARLDETVVVIRDGKAFCDIDAIREIWRILPLPGWWLCWLPGLRQLGRVAYYAIATRRYAISTAIGLGSCGIANNEPAATTQPQPGPASPARIWTQRLATALCLVFVSAVFLVVAASYTRAQQASAKGEASAWANHVALVKAASFTRVMDQWTLFGPEPPRTNQGLVVEAETRNGWKVDPLTGYAPDSKMKTPSRRQMGVLWSSYLKHLSDNKYQPFRSEFRRYLSRGGYAVDTKKRGMYIGKLKAYWISTPIAPPGGKATGSSERFELFTGRNVRPRSRNKFQRLKGLKSLRSK